MPAPPSLPSWMDPAAPGTRGVLGSEGPGHSSKGQKMETEKRIPKSGRAASPPAYIKPQEPARPRPPGLRGTIMERLGSLSWGWHCHRPPDQGPGVTQGGGRGLGLFPSSARRNV